MCKMSLITGVPPPTVWGCVNSLTVFVSSVTYDEGLGGGNGADEKCQILAYDAGLTGTFKAWIADDMNAPADTFTRGEAGYALVDGTIIATSWEDLTDGSLAAPIATDEFGQQYTECLEGQHSSDCFVWSCVTIAGARDPDCEFLSTSCVHRTPDDGSCLRGCIGYLGTALEHWTESPGGTFPCHLRLRLYCFQQ